MAEAAHGTAPSLEGKNVANPMAMILARRALLSHTGEAGSAPAARSARRASRRSPRARARPTSTETSARAEFTDEVIARVRAKLDVWASL